jgi:hypothetical protein
MWLRVLLVATLVVTGCVPAADAPTPFLAPTAPIAAAARAASPLSVTAVVPEPNASAVLFDSAVFVQFNKPVVPLTTLDHPRTDVPLQIEPAVDGSGKWISTGLYTFTPAEGWSPSTTYQLRVPQTDYAWSFTTLPPAVASTQPAPGARFTDPAASVRVTFNQPVDPDAVSFHLTPQAHGASEWTDRRTLVFHPIPALAPGAQYAASVSLGGVSSTHTWQFTTAPVPSVLRSIPEDGQEALHQGRFELFFSAPMDRDDVRARLQLDPPPDYPPYLNWTDYDTHVTLSGSMKRSTRYTLVLPAGVQDRFGRRTTDEFRMEFQTPAATPRPRLSSLDRRRG